MSKYDDIREEIRQTMIAVYGDPDAKTERKNEDRSFVPFLTPEKYHDPTHIIQEYHDVYQRCVARRRKEVERLKLENTERARFNSEREEYRKWLERKLHWEKSHKGMMFRELCPKVSDRVKESFSKDGKDIRVPFFKKLPPQPKEENGQSDVLFKKPELKPSKKLPIPEFLPPPPPPPLPRFNLSHEASSSVKPVIDEAKKRDLELFGDDEEFEKSQPPVLTAGPSTNKMPEPSVERHHSHKRSRTRSRSPSAKKHKKDKKEKKAKKEHREKERKEREVEKHEKERRQEHEERRHSMTEGHHSETRERSREHKHKKHKHKDHHRNE